MNKVFFTAPLLAVVLALTWARTQDVHRHHFQYADGKPGEGGGRKQQLDLPAVKGTVYAYASFGALNLNPGVYQDGEPQGQQIVTLGEKRGGKFRPAARFGVANNKDFLAPWEDQSGQVFMESWLTDGAIDYFGNYTRVKTVVDFKVKLELAAGRMTVSYSGRGDDTWSLLAENVKLMNPVSSINEIQVEQWPGANGVEDVVIRPEPWRPGEMVRPHPAAKKEITVAPDRGFQFQSFRSVWQTPARHVRIMREPPRWFGFPDIASIDDRRLVVTYNDGVSHGGGGGLFVRSSDDLGKTWDEPARVYPSGVNCPRLQVLQDGTMLLVADVDGTRRLLFADSHDGGRTWTDQRFFAHPDGKLLQVPSRIAELKDRSWLVAISRLEEFHGRQISKMEVYRSRNRGRDWEFLSSVPGWPPHSPDEAAMVVLGDGRVMLYSRESRNDGYPAIKAVSKDGGTTWKVHELPFAITGRPCAGLLRDGRVMVTFRSHVGRANLWAWVGDPDDATEFRPEGVHYNDSRSVGIKEGALYIDNDGIRGQFTQYFLRPPDSANSTVEITAEVKVSANAGRAASISIPFAGKLRLYPDHVEMAEQPSLQLPIIPGRFHKYRILSARGSMRLYLDGVLIWDTKKVDSRPPGPQGTYGAPSIFGASFGNEGEGGGYWGRDTQWPDVYLDNIRPETTGYSIWRNVTEMLNDPTTGKRIISWSAASDGFPDQYQLDHIIQVEGSANGADQGYSGWAELADGRVYVVNYTDDTAAPCMVTGRRRRQLIAKTQPSRVRTEALRDGLAWIRGTYLLPLDLPVDSRLPVR